MRFAPAVLSFALASAAVADIEKRKMFVAMKDYKVARGGFGSVLLLDATLENLSSGNAKDVQVACEIIGSSGTVIHTLTQTIYQVVPANKVVRVRGVSMGFANSQGATINCDTFDYVEAD